MCIVTDIPQYCVCSLIFCIKVKRLLCAKNVPCNSLSTMWNYLVSKSGLLLLIGEMSLIRMRPVCVMRPRLSVCVCVFVDHHVETETQRVWRAEGRGSCPQSNPRQEKSRIWEVSTVGTCVQMFTLNCTNMQLFKLFAGIILCELRPVFAFVYTLFIFCCVWCAALYRCPLKLWIHLNYS